MNQQSMKQQQARKSPEWITQGVIYQIMQRAFTPDGTLKAAQAKLPKLAELGVTIIYLCPIFVADDNMDEAGWSPRQKTSGMNNPRNPYRIKDYYHVDPEYGTDDDLKAFVQAAHELNLRVMLDMVYHTCGPKAVFLEKHPDFLTLDQDGKAVLNGWNFPCTNLANSELREYFCKNMEMWVRDFGVDGFRCDTAIFVPLDFWEEARRRLEAIAPEVVMLAESQKPEHQLFAFDCNYSFAQASTLYRIMKGEAPASAFRTEWEAVKAGWPSEESRERFYAKDRPEFETIQTAWLAGSRFIRYTDNHDLAQDHPERIEKLWGPAAVKATLALSFTLDGVPFLYNGQEVADANTHSIYGRLPIDWAKGETPVGKERFTLCQKLCALRQTERALTHGEFVWLDNDQPDAVLSYLRVLQNAKILTVINLTDKPVNATLPALAEAFEPLLVEGTKTVAQGRFALDAHGYFVGKK
jgi:glycosidase